MDADDVERDEDVWGENDIWPPYLSAERRAELQEYLDRWESEVDHGNRKGPFDSGTFGTGVNLSASDVLWLAGRKKNRDIGDLSDLHLEGARIVRSLKKARLSGAHFESTDLYSGHFEEAELFRAHFQGAFLGDAHLQGAFLVEAHVEDAILSGAHLEGTNLSNACLEGADLRRTILDGKTVLNGAMLDRRTKLGDIRWGGVGNVDLTQIDWSRVPRLGDELVPNEIPKKLQRKVTVEDYESVVRAYRQVMTQLRTQGMNEVANRLAYRAQVMQRRVFRHRHNWGAFLGSWLLDLISGYGYKPMRSLIAYVVIILAFAGAYLLNAQFAAPHLTWDEALVLSISAFHGRGFFTSGISLGDTLARLAAGEAIIGLLIEITFIATFTQRFFAR